MTDQQLEDNKYMRRHGLGQLQYGLADVLALVPIRWSVL